MNIVAMIFLSQAAGCDERTCPLIRLPANSLMTAQVPTQHLGTPTKRLLLKPSPHAVWAAAAACVAAVSASALAGLGRQPGHKGLQAGGQLAHAGRGGVQRVGHVRLVDLRLQRHRGVSDPRVGRSGAPGSSSQSPRSASDGSASAIACHAEDRLAVATSCWPFISETAHAIYSSNILTCSRMPLADWMLLLYGQCWQRVRNKQ